MMAKFSRLNVLNTMVETGLVPVFYHAGVEVASNIVQALTAAGVRCFEFTNRGDQAHLVFQELIQRFASDKRVILGAGTIIDPATAAQYIQLGANFIVGPVLNPEVAKICNRRKIPYSPGCGSLSEVSAAEELGVEICKVFPGKQVGGPDFVEAVRGPMPWTYIMPTGGVDPTQESITAWFKARVACVGIGSKLVRKDLIDSGDYAEMTRLAELTLAWIQAARQDYPLFW
jgi:2-dehydro-3-deoxyphosphogluconate aldolase / (4S)-4-hydroxy-2-oxoglutarate aldolase